MKHVLFALLSVILTAGLFACCISMLFWGEGTPAWMPTWMPDSIIHYSYGIGGAILNPVILAHGNPFAYLLTFILYSQIFYLLLVYLSNKRKRSDLSKTF